MIDDLLFIDYDRNSVLKLNFKNHIIDIIRNLSDDDEDKWETYSIIVKHLFIKKQFGLLNEIKYRLTDGEDPNIIFLDIIKNNDIDSFLWSFNAILKSYMVEKPITYLQT